MGFLRGWLMIMFMSSQLDAIPGSCETTRHTFVITETSQIAVYANPIGLRLVAGFLHVNVPIEMQVMAIFVVWNQFEMCILNPHT